MTQPETNSLVAFIPPENYGKELVKPSARWLWKYQNHIKRYKKRYGVSDEIKGEIWSWAGVTFHDR